MSNADFFEYAHVKLGPETLDVTNSTSTKNSSTIGAELGGGAEKMSEANKLRLKKKGFKNIINKLDQNVKRSQHVISPVLSPRLSPGAHASNNFSTISGQKDSYTQKDSFNQQHLSGVTNKHTRISLPDINNTQTTGESYLSS